MTKIHWRNIVEIIKETSHEFVRHNAIYYSAALSNFTIFALPPIIIIIIAIAGSILGKETISKEIYEQIAILAGKESADQIQDMVVQAKKAKPSLFSKFAGLATLFFAATGVFIAIQKTLNIMWDVKPKPKINIFKLFRDRILSFALIAVISFLLLVSLVVHALLVALVNLFHVKYATVFLMQTINFLFPLIVMTFLFAMIYKFLPDVRLRWKDVWMGAFVTALLFSIGKFLIGLYLGTSGIGSTYGTAGTVVIILLWVFYSSILLFVGAEFTQVYARRQGKNIQPTEYAVKIETKIIESGSANT